jgi:hypothetical protein
MKAMWLSSALYVGSISWDKMDCQEVSWIILCPGVAASGKADIFVLLDFLKNNQI